MLKIEIDSNNDDNKEIYYVYKIHSKYYIEKLYEKIKSITYYDYRDIHNLSYLGTVPNLIYSGIVVSSLTDEEYSALDKQQVDNPEKADFRKVNCRLHILLLEIAEQQKDIFELLKNYFENQSLEPFINIEKRQIDEEGLQTKYMNEIYQEAKKLMCLLYG